MALASVIYLRCSLVRPPSQLVRVVLRCFPSWPTPCSANSYFLNTAPVPGHQRDQGSETIGPPCLLAYVDHATLAGPPCCRVVRRSCKSRAIEPVVRMGCTGGAIEPGVQMGSSRAIEPVLRMGSSLVIEPGVFSAPPPVLSLLASPRPRALGVEGSPKSTPRRRPRASFLPPPPFSPFSGVRGAAARGRIPAIAKTTNSPAGARSAAARANVHVLCAHQTRSPRATCTFCAPTKLAVGRHKTWETALAVRVRPRAWWHGRSRTGVVARA